MKIWNWAFSPFAVACITAIIVCGFVLTGCDNDDTTPAYVPVTGITLEESTFGLLVDESKTLRYKVLPENATNKKVSWISSMPRFASVSAEGVVTGNDVGEATITVTTVGGQFRADYTVTVSRIAVTTVTLDKEELNLEIGESQFLSVEVLPENAANPRVRWETSDRTKATVTNGRVTGVAVGTATISAISNNNITASCAVSVGNVAVESVELDITDLNLDLWDSQLLTHTVNPEDATDKRVTWSSEPPGVVNVTDGMVTGVSVGDATITVTTVNGGKTESCVVKVRLFNVPVIPMVWIEPDTFTMGSPIDEPQRSAYETQHQVTLTKGFYMGAYQVTQEQYRAVMKANPSYFNVDEDEDADAWPVDSVTWYDAVEFCNKMSILEGFTPAYAITNRSPATGYPITSATVRVDWNANGYRLPTEAEWEYACRAGTETIFNFQQYDWDDVDEVYTGVSDPEVWGSDYISNYWANFNGSEDYNGRPTNNEDFDRYAMTLPWWFFSPAGEVWGADGLDHANAWGLYNMHGMLEEWCWDWYGGDYGSAAQEDPTGPSSGLYRILRGGSFYDAAKCLRSAYRNGEYPGYIYYSLPDSSGAFWIGFRVARFGTPPSGPSPRVAPFIDERSGAAKQKGRIFPQSMRKR
jgi:uncharacterized protein YjdB/formylglycine-generating enzyme required for sulfatase activity